MREKKRLKVQIGLFISFSVHKRDGIYSQRRISFDQRLRNYDRSTASLPHFAKWKRSIACLYEPIFQEQSVIQRLVKATSIKQHLRVSGYFSIYSYDFFLKLPFDSTSRYYSASFNTHGKRFRKKKNRNSAHSVKWKYPCYKTLTNLVTFAKRFRFVFLYFTFIFRIYISFLISLCTYLFRNMVDTHR